MPELVRRDFLRLVGLGAGAAAAAGCSDPVEKLVPYVIEPEVITPGIAVNYASTCRECPAACGLHVRTREGRPVKLEGNPNHPINQGKLCAKGQAGIGRTYHPDRFEGPMARGADGQLAPVSWEEAEAKLVEKLRGSAGKTWVLGSDRGPTVNGIIDGFVSAVGAAGRVVYEPFAHDGLRAATQKVFGHAVLPIFDVSGADLVIDFGSDFLDGGRNSIENARHFADAQDISKHPDGGARLVTIGPRLSMTGSNADDWVAASAGSEGTIALALAKAVYDKRGGQVAGDTTAIEAALRGVDPKSTAAQVGVDAAVFDRLVTQVVAASSAVALPPGVAATGPQATATAASVLLLNAVLGAVGSALVLPENETVPAAASLGALGKLVADMKAGRVDVLLVHDSNPLYSMPGGLGFADALAKVGFVVSFAALTDETSAVADLVLPDLTPLESWGDAAPREGVASLVQPTIRPLKDGKALGDTLLSVGRGAGATGLPAGTTHDVLKSNWSGTSWRQALDRGGVFGAMPARAVEVGSGVSDLSGLVSSATSLEGQGDYTLVAYEHSLLSDGSGAALPWLQEIPDPVTKASWISWAEVSEETARRLGTVFGDVIRVETGVGSVELPVYPRGGVRDDVVAVAIGQGHTEGHFASMANDGAPGQARGVNILSVLPASSDSAGARAFLSTKAKLTKTGAFSRIPLSQWTDNQRGRNLVPEVTLAALTGHAEESHGGGHHDGPPFEYDPANDAHPDSDYRWGMSIDNDRCTGCSACVAACYIENNVPVVGQEGATRHREMSWIRIERYVGEGDTEGGGERRPHPDREVLGQVEVRQAPMLCQHCGAAPCEAVCPVIATYHTDEGLNGMVFNRCVGTRYCANNCVYKVRRFNYFDYSRENWPGMLGMMLNPDVTVRAQGVMEKCSFCVQRIEAARQPAKDEKRPIADGEVVTACQQSCPTNAITFGNSRDPKSAVVAKAAQPNRAYHSLQVLNTRPAITYLAQVRRTDAPAPGHDTSHGQDHDKGQADKGSH
jgi:anaerobic selenocysteine-containing dehydrogenase/Fe-S-cluster-containing dehydrogenase component